MVGVQVHLMAAGGWQGPGHSALLRTSQLLPQPLATPSSKMRVGRRSLPGLFPGLFPQPAGGYWGSLLQALISILPLALAPLNPVCPSFELGRVPLWEEGDNPQ